MSRGIYFLVEEKSIQPIVRHVARKFKRSEDWFEVLLHQGNKDLENRLSKVLPGLSKPEGVSIVIMQDQDLDDCKNRKKNLLEKIPKTVTGIIKVRIVCRKLENWYLGDFDALEKAYPRFRSEKYSEKSPYRDPDNVDDALSALKKIIPELKDLKSISKVKIARKVALHLSVEKDKNKNKSFRQFIKTVEEIYKR